MSVRISRWLLGVLLISIAPMGSAQPAGSAAHVDREGFPLPDEAVTRIGSARLRTLGDIRCLAYAPDGKTIVSAAWPSGMIRQGSLDFWDARTGMLRRRVPILKYDFFPALVYRPDGKVLLFYCGGFLTEYDAVTGKILAATGLPHEQHVRGHFSSNAALLAVPQVGGSAALFELATGKEAMRIKPRAAPGATIERDPSMALSSDARRFAIRSGTGTIEVFDTRTGAKCAELDIPLKSFADTVHFSPDGRELLCHARTESWILVRNWAGNREVVRMQRDEPIHSDSWACYSPDGRYVAVGDERPSITVYDAASGKEIRQLPSGGPARRLAFSHDGRRLLVGNGAGAISQWEIDSGRPVGTADPLTALRVVRFTDRNHLLIATDRHELVDWRSGRVVQRYTLPARFYASSASLSSDGNLLIAPKTFGLLSLRDAKTGKELRQLGSQQAPIHRHVLTPDGRTLFAAGKSSMRIWKLPSLELVREKVTGITANLLAVDRDGRHVATTTSGFSSARDVDIWAAPTGTLVRSIRPRHGSVYGLAFTPTGEDLAIATGQMYGRGQVEVILVDVRTGREKRVIASPGSSLAQMRFSPDGRTVATAEYNGGPFRLWEVATGKERHGFDAHINAVWSTAFSGDGALIAASSIEAPAYVWDIYGQYAKDQVAEEWSAVEQQRLWQDLLDPDARIAFQAMRRLVRNPGPTVVLLRHYLKPAEPIDLKRVQQLLSELDSDDFDQRQKSYAALEKLGGRLEAQLQATLTQRPALELKRRVESLLEKLDQPTPERVRMWRAVEALEQIATPGSVELLRSFAGGARGAQLTRAASAALERLR